MNKLQSQIMDVFKKYFGYTPLTERLNDIQREFLELIKWSDVRNLKEEAGDLLASLIQLHTESGWDIEENITETLNKIERRRAQYSSLGRKTKVAIYGGAFNPITMGHIQVAKFLLNTSGEFDEVWLMPAFKHMYDKKMVSPEHRLEMCRLAASIDSRIKVFDYEIKNELAGETYYFVKKLKEEKELTEIYNFSIAIGQDNANSFENWVNYQDLEKLIRFVIIPRKGVVPHSNTGWYYKDPHIFLNRETDIMEVSSTEIRELLQNHYLDGSNERELIDKLGQPVFNYIKQNNLYNERY